MLQSIEAEGTLIGLALSDINCAEMLAQLPRDTFSYVETQAIYDIIKGLVAEHKKPDLITVGLKLPQEMSNAKKLMMEGLGRAVSPVMYREYEANCLELRKRRMLSSVCSKVISKASDPGFVVDQLESDILNVINDTGNKPQAISMREAVVTFTDEVTKNKDCRYTGIAGFDRLTGGIQGGQLIVLGARPGVGKSALGIQMASYVASKSGPVLMVSLEMTEHEIIARMASSRSGVKLQRIISKDMQDEDWRPLMLELAEINKLNVRFTMASTSLQIRREATAMQRNGGLKLILIDYIQLMRSDKVTASRYEQVSDITRELKLMAMELNVPIIGLTQFNRLATNGMPAMSDARDSGSIEQDANIFLILHPVKEPELTSGLYQYYSGCAKRGTELQILRVEKNRHGPTGDILLEFDKPLMKFVTLTGE